MVYQIHQVKLLSWFTFFVYELCNCNDPIRLLSFLFNYVPNFSTSTELTKESIRSSRNKTAADPGFFLGGGAPLGNGITD